MKDHQTSSLSLGLEHSLQLLRGAELSYNKKTPKIIQLFELSLEDPNVKQLYIEKTKHQKQSFFQNKLTSTTIAANQVITRQTETPLKKEKDIASTLSFQIEPLLPYPPDEAIIDYLTSEKSSAGTKLTFFSVKNEHLANHLSFWKELSVEPEVVTSPAAALTAFTQIFMKDVPAYTILYLGEEQLYLVLVYNGSPFAALNSQLPLLATPPEALQQELMKLFLAASKLSGSPLQKELFICGPFSHLSTIFDPLFSQENYTLHRTSSLAESSFSAEEISRFALPIGAALLTLPSSSYQINFRQKEFSFPCRWDHLVRPLGVYFALCFLTALLFYLFSAAYENRQMDTLRHSYENLLAVIGKTHEESEREFMRPLGKAVAKTEDLSFSQITDRVKILEKKGPPPQIFPLQPAVPLVSDLLAWLQTHPVINSSDETGDTLKLESLHYSMVKRPDEAKKGEHYQVKVELEFSSPTPKLAREFHDSLLTSNPFIDSKQDIKWSSTRGKYKAVFFLQDKTLYQNRGEATK